MTQSSQTLTAADVGTVAAVLGAPAPSKAALARGVFARCYGMEKVPQRKDIIAEAMKVAGLTASGAATYLQNFKKAEGLVKVRAAVAPAVAAEVKETIAA